MHKLNKTMKSFYEVVFSVKGFICKTGGMLHSTPEELATLSLLTLVYNIVCIISDLPLFLLINFCSITFSQSSFLLWKEFWQNFHWCQMHLWPDDLGHSMSYLSFQGLKAVFSLNTVHHVTSSFKQSDIKYSLPLFQRLAWVYGK